MENLKAWGNLLVPPSLMKEHGAMEFAKAEVFGEII
jgi:hypothetical protein